MEFFVDFIIMQYSLSFGIINTTTKLFSRGLIKMSFSERAFYSMKVISGFQVVSLICMTKQLSPRYSLFQGISKFILTSAESCCQTCCTDLQIHKTPPVHFTKFKVIQVSETHAADIFVQHLYQLIISCQLTSLLLLFIISFFQDRVTGKKPF